MVAQCEKCYAYRQPFSPPVAPSAQAYCILICHFIEKLHTATDCQGKPYHTDMLCLKEAHTLLKPHFSRLLLPHMCCLSLWCTLKTPNNNKTTATAGVGHVQLNFLTAGRDQQWKSIFSFYTRPASIIQRCVLLGDLALSLSRTRSHSLSHICSPSAANYSPPPSRLATVSVKIFWHFKCLKFQLAAPTLSRLSPWISAGSGEMGYNLLDMLKSPHVVSVAIYLPAATHPDPSPPPLPFCLYPSTKLIPVKKDVPVIFLSSLFHSSLWSSFPSQPSIWLPVTCQNGTKCIHSLLYILIPS